MGNWVIALLPAWNESKRVGASVEAIRSIESVKLVVVVDDGSTDGTADCAVEAGARCLRLDRNSGKGAALNSGVTAIRHWLLLEAVPPPAALLLADADLGSSAVHLHHLVQAVLEKRLDVAVADLPRQAGAAGFGVAMWMARRALQRYTGTEMHEPLSGQRALTWPALGSIYPFAPGFAVELAMTLDAIGAGLRVGEVPLPLTHRATGRDPAGIVHRGNQATALGAEMARRELRALTSLGRARVLRL